MLPCGDESSMREASMPRKDAAEIQSPTAAPAVALVNCASSPPTYTLPPPHTPSRTVGGCAVSPDTRVPLLRDNCCARTCRGEAAERRDTVSDERTREP